MREKGHVCQRKTMLTSQLSPCTVSSGIGPLGLHAEYFHMLGLLTGPTLLSVFPPE